MANDATDLAGEPTTDGRRLRRERSRLAVVDAMIDLVLDGYAPLTAEQVSERAGVSQASLFRYFASLDELRHEAIRRYFERFDDLIALTEIGEGLLDQRVERLVARRDAFYARTAPMARLMRRQAPDVPELAATIDRLRATFADQVAQHFAGELATRSAAARRERVATIAALTSFEAWEQLAPLGGASRRRAIRSSITSLL